MSRVKIIFAVFLLAAIVGVVPQAHATPTVNTEVLIAGSSGAWTSMGVGAWNSGTSLVASGGITCHWTSGSNKVNLVDTRSTTPNVDPGTLWVVWDNNASASTCAGDGTNAATNVWAYIKVDSVVGARCYFAVPKCELTAPSGNINVAGAGKITSAIWGADASIPSYIQPLFTGTTLITVAASDIRPEDAQFAACRANSALGAGTVNTGDKLDGLGYNSNNTPGTCPVYSSSTAQSKGVGNPILSSASILEGGSSVSQANVLAFNISGKDPITNTTVPGYSITPIGAYPVVFIISRSGALADLTNATETQLQTVFSGTDCNASVFGLTSGAINVFIREPNSGTMNTAEATVFRRPTINPSGTGGAAALGLSQETGVGTTNPFSATCASGSGKRWRTVGSSEEVAGVQDSQADFGALDGIGYSFFSYENISSIAGSSKYGYIQLNGVDPIFASYAGAGDPGQPGNGELPLTPPTANCNGVFPCPEYDIWKNQLSLPNLRNGTYRSWAVIRLIATGTASTNAKALVTASNKVAVGVTPDYVPFVGVQFGTFKDAGLVLVRSHYQQTDGSGVNIGKAPVNTGGSEAGGEMGGAIIPTLAGVSDTQTQLVQDATTNAQGITFGPVIRP
jgi:hypothetical protein